MSVKRYNGIVALTMGEADPAGALVQYEDYAALEKENERLRTLLNTPELNDFPKAVLLEAAHQRERWGSDHDAGKTQADWFWLIGYLAGKALNSLMRGDLEKGKHHIITTAAALNNWHAQLLGASDMRPGISKERVKELTGEA